MADTVLGDEDRRETWAWTERCRGSDGTIFGTEGEVSLRTDQQRADGLTFPGVHPVLL